MINCRQFRDSLDCYLDGELSAAALAAADAHRQQCPQCERAVDQHRQLRAAVRRAVGAASPPAGLEARIRGAVASPWSWASIKSRAPRRAIAALAAAAALVVAVAAASPAPIDVRAANALDRLALRIDDTHPVHLHGRILCRDCELAHRYGIESPCPVIGHHGALATDDGHLWNFVEQRTSAPLIHDEGWLGKRVIVRGRLFRTARTLVVEGFELGG